MSETIPEDVMQAARTVADSEVNFGSYEVNTLAIARAIVAAKEEEREIVAAWMIRHSFATGHGDTLESLLDELAADIALALLARDERAAKIAEMRSEYGHNHGELIYLDGPAIASAIRDRSKT